MGEAEVPLQKSDATAARPPLRAIPPLSAMLLAVVGFGATLGPAAIAARLSRSLAAAVEAGDVDDARRILSHGGDPNGFVGSETLVGRAVADGRRELVALLLSKGADPSSPLSTGETPLLRAITLHDRATAKLLLEAGASPNLRSAWGELPLHRAAAAGDTGTVRLLLEHGADPGALGPDSRTALLVATETSHPEVAEILRERGRS